MEAERFERKILAEDALFFPLAAFALMGDAATTESLPSM